MTAATLLEKNIIGTHGDWYYCSYNHKLNKTRYERDDLEAANNVMTFITTGRIPWLTRNDPKEDMEKKRKVFNETFPDRLFMKNKIVFFFFCFYFCRLFIAMSEIAKLKMHIKKSVKLYTWIINVCTMKNMMKLIEF